MLQYILLVLYVCGTIHTQEVQALLFTLEICTAILLLKYLIKRDSILSVTTHIPFTTITIPLNETLGNTNRELHSSIINVKGISTTHFQFTDVNKKVSFIIFQAHSQFYNITMCNGTCTEKSMIIGTNIGLFSYVEPMSTFLIINPNSNDLNVLIAVHGYYESDPVPGGCNMEDLIEIAPYMKTKVSTNRDYIDIAAAAPAPRPFPLTKLSKAQDNCAETLKLDLQFFVLYLPERDYSIDTYFGGIRAMMNADSIREHGASIPQTHVSTFRRTLSAYPGTGAVFVALYDQGAEFENTTFDMVSIYVPTVTYVCSPQIEDDCLLLGDLLSQMLCASLLFVGLFVCYFGHKFFKTEMFIFGMLSGVILTYILISLIAEIRVEQAPLLGASFLSGILFGFIWLTFWWFYGIPVFSVLLATLTLGFFAACVLYNQLPGSSLIFMQDLNFWTLFILIMLLTAVMLTPATYPANILCCAILGAYAAIYPIDYCLGTNLKYIIINTVRRATVPNFYYAVLSPPFEWNDALMVLLWVTLATTGFLFQHYHNRGKPPFPPPPRNIRERPEGDSYGTRSPYIRVAPSDPPLRSTATLASNERTPLLA